MLDKTRLRNNELFEKVVSPEEASQLICDGMTIGIGGFTAIGCPKVVIKALADAYKKKAIKLTVLSGGSTGPEVENALASARIIKKRAPGTLAVYEPMKRGISTGEILYSDNHYSIMPQMIEYGFWGSIDIALIEAIGMTEQGHIIPSTSVGSSATFAKVAKKLIIEINTSQPLELEGLHDIYTCEKPPNRKPIPILKTTDRVGTQYIEVKNDKIAAIVESTIPDHNREAKESDEASEIIAQHLVEFIKYEIKKGRMPKTLLPLQSGFGNVGNAVLGHLEHSGFSAIDFFTELGQPSMIDLVDAGIIKTVSCSALPPDLKTITKIINDPIRYRNAFILRPIEISNHPELIRRLGVIAINTPLEIDIYGNANSTHILGSQIVNTIGGSGDYMRNAYLSVLTTPSLAKGNTISRIVPMVSHVDHTEHDWHVLITEIGVADLRGMAPRERAISIINNCAHPNYRPQLREYFDWSLKRGGHTPHDLRKAFDLYKNYTDKGTMLNLD